MALIKAAVRQLNCNEKDIESICKVRPVNETKGFNKVNISEVPAEDWIIFGIYFTFAICVALLSAFRNRGSLSGFFLTARSANWVLIGVSMFTSNIGSGHFIGLAGSAAVYGISVAIFELNAIIVLPLLGWFFAPVFMASNVSTMPEYLRARFGGRRIQIYIACNALFLYIFTKISADLYAGILYMENVLGFPRFAAIILLLTVAACFTIIGGMTAVLWTSVVQLFVILLGAFYLLVKVLIRMGGLEALFAQYLYSKPNPNLSNSTWPLSTEEMEAIEKCGNTPPHDRALHLVQPVDDKENAPWPGALIGITILSIWYWCCDQVITQHVLASKNLTHAKLGCLLTAVFKFVSPVMFVLPGMASRVIYADFVGCSDPVLCCCFCKSASGCTNHAYTLLAADVDNEDKLLPNGARGLMAITIVAALISSFVAIFNAASAIFTMDIWRLVRPTASSKELQIVGRVFIIIVCTVSMLWMVIINSQQYLYTYIQQMTAYFSPPLAAVFMLAIFWTRCNEQGAFIGLMVGLLIGIVRFALEFSYSSPSCAESHLVEHDLRPPALKNVHYLYFAIILFGITTLVTVCLSLVTEPPHQSRVDGLTYWTRYKNRITRRPKAERDSTGSTPKDVENRESKSGGISNNVNDENRDLTVFANISQTAFQQSNNNHDESNRNVSRWRHFLNWLCGIELETSELDVIRSPTAAVGFVNKQLTSINHSPTSNTIPGPSAFHLVPISNGLFEEQWLHTACSIALVALITVFLFVIVLLF